MSKTKDITSMVDATIPDWADSGLLMVGERSEILYLYRNDNQLLSKFVSPEDVARAFGKITYDTGPIPEGIIRMGRGPAGYWGILRTQPQIVAMSFREDDPIKAPIPGCILFGVGNTYRIYAEIKGELFHAPFDNVFDNGDICWGKNSVPTVKNAQDLLKAWTLFWAAPFTHRNDAHGGMLTYKSLYEDLSKKRAPKFNRKLKPAKVTINSLVELAAKEEN
jgi:hypothetical protein